jgi:hypothetical protein
VSGALLVQVEQEEEFLTNTLQKKLEKVTRDGSCQQPAQTAAATACCSLLRLMSSAEQTTVGAAV